VCVWFSSFALLLLLLLLLLFCSFAGYEKKKTHKFEIRPDATQNQALAARRPELAPILPVRRVDFVRVVGGPLNARRLGVAVVRDVVDVPCVAFSLLLF